MVNSNTSLLTLTLGDDKSHYWSSTAVSGSSEAYIGDGTPKDRDLQYRVIAVRKNDN